MPDPKPLMMQCGRTTYSTQWSTGQAGMVVPYPSNTWFVCRARHAKDEILRTYLYGEWYTSDRRLPLIPGEGLTAANPRLFLRERATGATGAMRVLCGLLDSVSWVAASNTIVPGNFQSLITTSMPRCSWDRNLIYAQISHPWQLVAAYRRSIL